MYGLFVLGRELQVIYRKKDRGAVLGNPTDPKSWTCVPRDRELSGVVPPERVAEDLERDAKKMLDEGKTTSFCRKFYFFFARNTAEGFMSSFCATTAPGSSSCAVS